MIQLLTYFHSLFCMVGSLPLYNTLHSSFSILQPHATTHLFDHIRLLNLHLTRAYLKLEKSWDEYAMQRRNVPRQRRDIFFWTHERDGGRVSNGLWTKAPNSVDAVVFDVLGGLACDHAWNLPMISDLCTSSLCTSSLCQCVSFGMEWLFEPSQQLFVGGRTSLACYDDTSWFCLTTSKLRGTRRVEQ